MQCIRPQARFNSTYPIAADKSTLLTNSTHLHTKYQYNKSSTDGSPRISRSFVQVPIPQASLDTISVITADKSKENYPSTKHIKSLIRSRAPMYDKVLVER